MRKLIRPAHCDPDNSVDLFDADRRNDFDELYCIEPGILREEVPGYWDDYVRHMAREAAARRFIEQLQEAANILGKLIADYQMDTDPLNISQMRALDKAQTDMNAIAAQLRDAQPRVEIPA